MGVWKVHAVWALVAVILAAALVRSLSGRDEPAFQVRERKLQEEIRDLRAVIGAPEGPSARLETSPSGPWSDDAESKPGVSVKKPGTPKEPAKAPTAEEIRILMKSAKKDERRKALGMIEKVQDKALQAALLREAARDGEADLKYGAISMFDQIGRAEGTQLALEFLGPNEPAWVRARAARELSQIRDPATMSALQTAFLDPDPTLKYWSAKALQTLGWEDPVRQLVAATGASLADPDGAVRETTVEKLGHLGSSAVIPLLGEALRDSNSRVRREALQSLGRTGLPAAVPVIQQGLADAKREVRLEAIGALYDIGGAEALAALQTALRDPDPDVVQKAQSAIDRLRQPKRG